MRRVVPAGLIFAVVAGGGSCDAPTALDALTDGSLAAKPSASSERPDEHADNLERDQQRIQRQRYAMRHEVLPVLHEAVRPGPGDDDGEKRDRGQGRGHVVIAGRGDAAVQDLREERILRRMQDRVVDQRQHVEDRDDPLRKTSSTACVPLLPCAA